LLGWLVQCSGYGCAHICTYHTYHLGTCPIHRCILSVGVGLGRACSYMAQVPRPVPMSRICLRLISWDFHGSYVLSVYFRAFHWRMEEWVVGIGV
jgi:hypothetical protein